MKRRRWFLLTALLGALTLAGCGGGGDKGASKSPPAQETTTGPGVSTQARSDDGRCEKASSALVSSLKGSLKRGRLVSPMGVKSKAEFTTPRGLQEGVYFVSADVKPNPGIATWAVSVEAWRTGGGLIFAIDEAARAVSNFGADVDPSRFGLDKNAEGYEESRNCVGSSGY